MIFTIDVFRPTALVPDGRPFNQGTLRFRHNDVVIHSSTWWDQKRIDPGCYLASATRMDSKWDGRPINGKAMKREAIFLIRKIPHLLAHPDILPTLGTPLELVQPLPVDNDTRKARGVFIHKGQSPSDSEACVTTPKSNVETIWDTIHPKNEVNVIVNVYDYEPGYRYGPMPTM